MLFVGAYKIFFWVSFAVLPTLASICLITAFTMGLEPELQVLAVFTFICILSTAVYSVILIREAMLSQIGEWT